MATFYIDPDGDVKTDWTENPAGTAYTCINDAVRQPTAPTVPGQYISDSTNYHSCVVTLSTSTLATNEFVVSATTWTYAMTQQYHTIQVTATNGSGMTIPQSQAAAWFSGSSTFSTPQTQTQLDNMNLTLNLFESQAQAADSIIYATYVEIVTAPFPFGISAAGVVSAGQSGASLAVVGGPIVQMGASPAQSGGTLALNAPTQVPVAVCAAQSNASLPLRAQTRVPVAVCPAQSSGSLSIAAPTTVPLAASAAVSSDSLSVTASPKLPLAVSAAQSAATLALSASTTIPLSASVAVSSPSCTPSTLKVVPLNAANAVASASLSLTAPTGLPLSAASAVAGDSLAITASPTLPLSVVNAVAICSLSITAPTKVPLGVSAGSSGDSLALTLPIPLAAANAVSTGSCGLTAPTQIIAVRTVYDEFTDTDGTLLTSHAANVGGTWLHPNAGATSTEIRGNRAAGISGGALSFNYSPTTVAANLVLAFIVRFSGTATGRIGPIYRVDDPTSATANGYYISFQRISGAEGIWPGLITNGGPGVSVSGTTFTFNTDQDYSVKVIISGDSHAVYVDGSLALSWTDAIGAASGSGVGVASVLGSDALMDTFQASILSGAVSAASLTITASSAPYFTLSTGGSSAATLSLSAPTAVGLNASAGSSAASLGIAAPTKVPLAASGAVASTSLSLKAPTVCALGASAATSTDSLALSAPTTVPLSASTGLSNASLALASYVPLNPAGSVSAASLALKAPTVVPLGASTAQSSGSLNITIPGGAANIPLNPSPASSITTLALTAATAVALSPSAGQSAATASLRAPALFVLAAGATANTLLNLNAPSILGTLEADGQSSNSLTLGSLAVSHGMLSMIL